MSIHSASQSTHTGATAAEEDYVRAIYGLSGHSGGQAVATNDLADRLQVTASASAMIKKLTKRGLAKHVPYRGVSLTAAGERVALEVIRHHRLLEAAY